MHAFEFDTRKFSPERPPVVLLGGLNVLRALGRAGIPAIVAASCADEISAGASTGGEMGAFRDLQQPQRIANVRAALNEYLPWGLESGLLFTT